MSASALEIVRDLYAAFADRDEPRLRELLHPDVEWNQCSGFPGGARRRGVDDVLQGVFAGNRTAWEGFEAPVREFVASEDRVVALGHYAGRHAATGRFMHAEFAHAYVVEDGRVVRFDQVADTAPMVAAASPD